MPPSRDGSSDNLQVGGFSELDDLSRRMEKYERTQSNMREDLAGQLAETKTNIVHQAQAIENLTEEIKDISRQVQALNQGIIREVAGSFEKVIGSVLQNSQTCQNQCRADVVKQRGEIEGNIIKAHDELDKKIEALRPSTFKVVLSILGIVISILVPLLAAAYVVGTMPKMADIEAMKRVDTENAEEHKRFLIQFGSFEARVTGIERDIRSFDERMKKKAEMLRELRENLSRSR